MNQTFHTKNWKLPACLPTIPSEYTLGYCHATIRDVPPQTVADRIVEGLAQHSIAAMPHESQEVGRETPKVCCVIFVAPEYHSPLPFLNHRTRS